MGLKGKKILVTGGTGLVGSHLLHSLISAGERPRAIFRKTSNRDIVMKVFSYYSENPEELYKTIEWVEADILDYESIIRAMEDCEQVYHCAAAVSFDSSQSETVIRNNTSGTANIVKACLARGIGKLCHVSSVASLGARDKESIIDENHQWDDSDRHSAYAVSKHLSELEVWRGIEMGLNAVIVNPSVIFGPGDWTRGSSQYFSQIAGGMPFYTSGITGYVDVRDVVLTMTSLMNSSACGERFIVSSENLSFRDIFVMIAEALNVRKPFLPIPRLLSYPALAAARLGGFIIRRKSALTTATLSAAFSKIFFDSTKLVRATGISFIPIKESISDTVKHYLSDLNYKAI